MFFPLRCIITYLATRVQEINIDNPCKGVKHIKPIFYPDSSQLLNTHVLTYVHCDYYCEHKEDC